MIGAIAGDIIGSIYEQANIKTKDFPLFQRDCVFTDDTVMSLALADAFLHGRDIGTNFRRFYSWYPRAGYGNMFKAWAVDPLREAYNSFGNGSAMRVSAVAYACNTATEVLKKLRKARLSPTTIPKASKERKPSPSQHSLRDQGKARMRS